jgi:hypothetical protein
MGRVRDLVTAESREGSKMWSFCQMGDSNLSADTLHRTRVVLLDDTDRMLSLLSNTKVDDRATLFVIASKSGEGSRRTPCSSIF